VSSGVLAFAAAIGAGFSPTPNLTRGCCGACWVGVALEAQGGAPLRMVALPPEPKIHGYAKEKKRPRSPC
jgi:hypothetical protein